MPTPGSSRHIKKTRAAFMTAAAFAAVAGFAPMAAQQAYEPGEGRTQETFVYRIGPEDRLFIEVRNEPEVSGTYTVRPDGFVTLPLTGDVRAVGRTTSALEAALTERLVQFINDPFVSVRVDRARGHLPDRIRVVGEAVTPEAVAYRDGITLAAVIEAIGGLPDDASLTRAYILRRTEDGGTRRVRPGVSGPVRGLVEAGDFLMLPGDILVLPEAWLAGDISVDPTLTLRQSYSDNLFLAPDGLEDDGYITSIIPGLNARFDTNRLRAGVSGGVAVQIIRGTDNNNVLLAPRMAGNARVEAVKNRLFVDAAATAQRALLNPTLGRSPNPGNVTNQQVVQTYSVSPSFRGAISNWASYELRYSLGVVLIENDSFQDPDFATPNAPGGDTVSNEGTITINSGPRYGRFNWNVRATWSDFSVDNGFDRVRREIIFRGEYAVTRSFFLITEVGYQNFDGGGFAVAVDGAQYLGGFRWSPGDRLRIEVLGGQRDGGETVQAEASYRVSDAISVSLLYEDRAQIDQGRLLRNLPQTPDDLDEFDPSPPPLTFTNDPTRLERLTGTVSFNFGRAAVSGSASYLRRELGVVNGLGDEEAIQGNASFSYQLPSDFAFIASGQVVQRDFLGLEGIREFRRDRTIFVNGILRYTGFQRFGVDLGYSFADRASTGFGGFDFTENTVFVAVTARF